MKPTNAKASSKFWIPVFIVFIIHNFGEYTGDLPKWGQTHFGFSDVGITQFVFGIIVILLTFVLIAIAFYYRTNKRITHRLLTVFCVFMIGNTFVHLGTSLLAKSPSPGLFEALLLGLPVYSYTLYQILRSEKFLSFKFFRQK